MQEPIICNPISKMFFGITVLINFLCIYYKHIPQGIKSNMRKYFKRKTFYICVIFLFWDIRIRLWIESPILKQRKQMIHVILALKSLFNFNLCSRNFRLIQSAISQQKTNTCIKKIFRQHRWHTFLIVFPVRTIYVKPITNVINAFFHNLKKKILILKVVGRSWRDYYLQEFTLQSLNVLTPKSKIPTDVSFAASKPILGFP